MNPFQQSSLLTPGTPAPDFELPDQHGQPVRLSERLSHGWVVLFFYPKDHSPVCTTQVCAFRNAHDDFRDAGAEVIGISSDSIDSHQRFAEHHQLPFTLVADTDGKVRAQYGVPKTFGLLPGRVTFVIAPDRTIRMAYPSQFNAKAHMEKALHVLRREAGKTPIR
jgi:peroxiredoxin Q/BCP